MTSTATSLENARPLELLLVGCSSADPYSTIVVNPTTGTSNWSFKGSELQGSSTGIVKPLGNSGSHFIISIKDKPLIHTVAIHSRDRFHHKAVVADVINDFCTTKDGRLLIAAIRNQIHIWTLHSGELLCVHDAHYQFVTHVRLSVDDSMLFTSAKDGAVHCYLLADLVSMTRIAIEPYRKWTAHSLAVCGLYVDSCRNPRVVSCGMDHMVTIHSVSLDACLLKVSAERPLTACAMDPSGMRLFVGTDQGNVVQLNLYALGDTKEFLIQSIDQHHSQFPVFAGHCEQIVSLAVSGDGSLMASGDVSGKYCIWEIASKQCLKVATMRGAVLNLQFIPNYTSFTASEYKSAWKPNLQLQRTQSKFEKIYIGSGRGPTPFAKSFEKQFKELTDKWFEKMNVDEALLSIATASKKVTEEVPMEESVEHVPSKKRAKDTEPDATEPEKKLKKKKKKKAAKVVEEVEEIEEIVDEGMDDEESTPASSARIQKLEAEIRKLKQINSEIYKFAAKNMLKGSKRAAHDDDDD